MIADAWNFGGETPASAISNLGPTSSNNLQSQIANLQFRVSISSVNLQSQIANLQFRTSISRSFDWE